MDNYEFLIIKIEHHICQLTAWFSIKKIPECTRCHLQLPKSMRDSLMKDIRARIDSIPVVIDDDWTASIERMSTIIGPPEPHSLIIRPTFHGFSKYSREDLLHVGISDSAGRYVYNYDHRGISCEQWRKVLSIPLSGQLDAAHLSRWDDSLVAHREAEIVRDRFSESYHATGNNCYSFVVRFLNNYFTLSVTKESLAIQHIAKPLSEFELFFQWHESILARGYSLHLLSLPLTPASSDQIASSSTDHASPSQLWACDACNNIFSNNSIRWHCSTCVDYDLCSNCISSSPLVHDPSHTFLK